MKRVAIVVALALPFLGVPFAMRAVATRVADTSARALARLAPLAAPPPTLAPEPSLAPAPAPASAPAPAPAKHASLFIPSRAVAKLTPAHAQRVSASPDPEGLRLHGVSSLGLGLADGDVLLSIAGAPIRSQDAAIAAITGAVARGAKHVTGVVRRGAQRIAITVELPPTCAEKRCAR